MREQTRKHLLWTRNVALCLAHNFFCPQQGCAREQIGKNLRLQKLVRHNVPSFATTLTGGRENMFVIMGVRLASSAGFFKMASIV